MKNPFKPPKLRHDDPFGTKKPVPNSLDDWQESTPLNADDPEHVKALDELLKLVTKDDDDKKKVEDEVAQDVLYQKGYNTAIVGDEPDMELVDDSNYWLGYQDGRGDAEIPYELNEDNPVYVPNTAELSVSDVHDAVNNIFDKRKASYYPLFLDGMTKYQCDVCHFISDNETAIANHVRLAHGKDAK